MTDHQSLDTAESETLSNLGARLRHLRARNGMTLAELSLKSGVSIGMLSHIERGQSSPSLKTLERLRLALDVPLASFFGADLPQDNGVVVRAEQRTRLAFDRLGLVKELLSPPGNSDLEVLMLVMTPGGSSGEEPWTRNGEKAGFVVAGRFELTIGERVYALQEGDSFQFDSRQPHTFRNIADGETRVLWIIRSAEPG